MYEALPSEINIQTAYLTSPNHAVDRLQSMFDESPSSIAARLLYAAQQTEHVLGQQEVRAVFNDLQQLLETRNDPIKADWDGLRADGLYAWRLELDSDLVRIRNLMNLQLRLILGPELDCESALNMRCDQHRLTYNLFNSLDYL